MKKTDLAVAFLAIAISIPFSKCFVNEVEADILGPPYLLAPQSMSSDVFVIFSPQNVSYNANLVLVNFTVSALTSIYDVGYSIDNGEIQKVNNLIKISEVPAYTELPPHVQVTYMGTLLLSGLSDGNHILTVYNGAQYTGIYARYSIGGYATANFIIDTEAPILSILQTESSYNSSQVPINFTINEPASWMAFSLDNQANETVNGNITLTDLHRGLHSLTIYANDTAGNMGASQTTIFSISLPTLMKTEPYSTATAAAVSGAVAVVVVVAGLLVYFKKRKHQRK